MRQGTTTEHTFTIPLDASEISQARVTYTVGGRVVLRKETADCQMEGKTVRINLTQEDTLRFPAGHWFTGQLRALTISGDAVGSGPLREYVDPCLDGEVLR